VKRISSQWTFVAKYVFPALSVLLLLAFAAAMAADPEVRGEPVFFIWVLAVFGIGAFGYYRFLWNLADVVEDGGSFLLVRRRGIELRVALVDVMNVAINTTNQVRRLSLRLRSPGVLGDEVLFIPPRNFSFKPFARNAVCEDLILRVDAAKRSQS